MAFIDYVAREINFKIVYYGPGLSGKTSNFMYLYDKIESSLKSRMISLVTDHGRNLFFDFCPQGLRPIAGMQVRIHLYTIPGSAFYTEERHEILKGVDGLVYVADSLEIRREANVEILEDLRVGLAKHKLELSKIPKVFQFNKRDLNQILTVDQLNADLNPSGASWFESIAPQGVGVFATLRECFRLALAHFYEVSGINKGAPANAKT